MPAALSRKYVLDTDCFIDAAYTESAAAAYETFVARAAPEVWLSAVVAAELRAGARLARDRRGAGAAGARAICAAWASAYALGSELSHTAVVERDIETGLLGCHIPVLRGEQSQAATRVAPPPQRSPAVRSLLDTRAERR